MSEHLFAEQKKKENHEKAHRMADRKLLSEGVTYPIPSSKKTDIEHYDAICRYNSLHASYYARALQALDRHQPSKTDKKITPPLERKPYNDN